MAQTQSVLIAAYWVCLIVGGGLLLFSTFVGNNGGADHGADFGADTDFGSADAGADVDLGTASAGDAHTGPDAFGHGAHGHMGHGHAVSLAKWFSLRFVFFFLAVFGLLGVALTHLTNVGSNGVLAAATVGGLIFGQGTHQLLRQLARSSGDSTPQIQEYVNRPARVTIRIVPPKKGEVALRIGQGERFVPAVSAREGVSFPTGREVVVTAYENGVARVVSREEYEFLKGSGPSRG